MDRGQEELRVLGFFGIFKESFKIVFSWKKIFSQITLALILPFSFIYLFHIQISELLSGKINKARNGVYFWLFEAVYFIFLLILSLVSTSAVVYTIASIYTAKEATFKKVIGVTPRVWKRLMVTFLWIFLVLFVYEVIAAVLFYLWARFCGFSNVGLGIFVVLVILYLIGLIYICVVWQLASVLSVLEDAKGIKATNKSKALLKGKMGVAVGVFLTLTFCLSGVQVLFEMAVVQNWERNKGISIPVAILCLLLLCIVFLFGFVTETVLYFVCKSHHNEDIERSSLADHLEVYHGNYVRLRPKGVQMGEVNV